MWVSLVGGYAWLNYRATGIFDTSSMGAIVLSHKVALVVEFLPDRYAGLREILVRHRDALITKPFGDHTGQDYIYRAIPELRAYYHGDDRRMLEAVKEASPYLIRTKPITYLHESGKLLFSFWMPVDYPLSTRGSGALRGVWALVQGCINALFLLQTLVLAGMGIFIAGVRALQRRARFRAAAVRRMGNRHGDRLLHHAHLLLRGGGRFALSRAGGLHHFRHGAHWDCDLAPRAAGFEPAAAARLTSGETPGGKSVKISIVVPVYNEFVTLPLVLQRILEAPLPEGCEREIIIVDDGSTDGTTELLDKYGSSGLVVVHHSVVNFGKGAAVRVGIAKASGDIDPGAGRRPGIRPAGLREDPAAAGSGGCRRRVRLAVHGGRERHALDEPARQQDPHRRRQHSLPRAHHGRSHRLQGVSGGGLEV